MKSFYLRYGATHAYAGLARLRDGENVVHPDFDLITMPNSDGSSLLAGFNTVRYHDCLIEKRGNGLEVLISAPLPMELGNVVESFEGLDYIEANAEFRAKLEQEFPIISGIAEMAAKEVEAVLPVSWEQAWALPRYIQHLMTYQNMDELDALRKARSDILGQN